MKICVYGYDWPPFVCAPEAVGRTRKLRYWYGSHPITRPLRHRLAQDWQTPTPEAKGQRRPGRANRMVVTPAPVGPARLRVWKALERQHHLIELRRVVITARKAASNVEKAAKALGDMAASVSQSAREALERLERLVDRIREEDES